MAKTIYVQSGAKIRVVGCGGGGCNAVTRMVREQVRGVEFIAMNTDAQALAITEAPVRIQLGEKNTRGLGSGGDNKVGHAAAEESRDEIRKAIAGSDMIFITAGMGGGTGTGSAPVVAKIAKEMGTLTIAVVTKPFAFEGTHRMKVAEEGIAELMPNVDTLVLIPNDRLFDICDQKTGVDGAFRMADEVLCNGVQAIAEVITVPGLINLDFADVSSVMKNAGPAWMSIGHGSGTNRAADAAKKALQSPLLDVSIEGSKGVIFNIAGDSSLTLYEVNAAADIIRKAVDPDANVIFGVLLDSNMGNEVRLTLIATGFNTRDGMASATREREIFRALKNLKSEDELEVPSFMRQRSALASRRLDTVSNAPPQYAGMGTGMSRRPMR
ncbi:MAG: cell division protein FtsZ [Dehalococcoidia bacterium]|nr:cell division protein FtsZ [Dehalococcoidia bacterium]